MKLAELNKHSRDTRIKFRDEGHKYWIDNDDTDLISSTTFIKKFFDNFDTDTVVSNIIKSEKYVDPNYKYYGMKDEEIKKLWNDNSKKAMSDGTKLHLDIEHFYNDIDVKNNSVEYKQFLNFYEDHKKLQIYRTEWLIFCDILKITGSIDAVFIDDNNELTICDWKRSKEISYKNFNNHTAPYPFDHLQDCNYSQYCMQLNLYRLIIETYYGFKVKEMFLIVMHPNNKSKNYEKIMVPRLQKESEWLFDIRCKELNSLGYNVSIKLDNYVEKDIRELDCLKFKGKKEKPVMKKLFDIKLTPDGLSEKQQVAYDLVARGENVFITSPAGGGKTFFIKTIYKRFKETKNIAVTSTTGTSAILIDGVTLYSYLGIGLGTSDVSSLFLMIKKRRDILKRWKDLDILIIDEISMLSPALFDKLENLARVIRKSASPFGGIQLILSGDFLQLPVVGDSDSFCFDAVSWNTCIKNIVYLNENFRQGDTAFKKCLNEIRIGNISDETANLLRSRVNVKLENEFGILPTKIYSLNRDVEQENDEELDKLVLKNQDLEFFQYDLTYEILLFSAVKNIEETIKKLCNAPFSMQLCIGAQVMLLYNMDVENKLVNGSRGVIVGFENDLPRVKFMNGMVLIIDYKIWTYEENGEIVLQWTQIPLKVAFAISMHKSQGITIDYAEVDLNNVFENAQAYVALSRVRTLEGLSIKNFNKLCIRAHPKAIDFYSKFV
jgi:ATP-dependent DNA helicase PIF1